MKYSAILTMQEPSLLQQSHLSVRIENPLRHARYHTSDVNEHEQIFLHRLSMTRKSYLIEFGSLVAVAQQITRISIQIGSHSCPWA